MNRRKAVFVLLSTYIDFSIRIHFLHFSLVEFSGVEVAKSTRLDSSSDRLAHKAGELI